MTHSLPNADEEAERQMLIPAGDWYGKRAHGPKWDDEFLNACLASGSIRECGAQEGTVGSWVRVLTVAGFAVAVVAAATFGLWWQR